MRVLERDAVIAGYAAILGKPQEPGICALVSLRLAQRPCKVVLDKIRSWPEIVHGYSVAGPLDAVLVVHAGSAQALSELSDRLGAVPGVSHVEATIVLETFVDRGLP